VIVESCCGGAAGVEDAFVADFAIGCDHLRGVRSVVQGDQLEIKSRD
jgi:hypothetical protein